MDQRLETLSSLERRIELLRGRVQVGGSPETTRFVLGQLLTQTSLAELRALGGDTWREAARLASATVEPAPKLFDFPRHYGLLQRLSLPLFDLLGDTALTTYSRGIAVSLGDSVLTPDAFVAYDAIMREYYLDGPPLLAIEIIDPHNRSEEIERLGIYEANGVPEVWWLEPAKGCLQQFILQKGSYRLHSQREGILESAAIKGLSLDLTDVWQPGWHPGLALTYRDKTSRHSASQTPSHPSRESGTPARSPLFTEAQRDELVRGVLGVLADLNNEPDRGGFKANLPFAPEIGLAPRQVGFEAFISWLPEVKFEIMEGRLIVGSEQGNYELLGLLFQSIGLTSAFALLPQGHREVLRGAN